MKWRGFNDISKLISNKHQQALCFSQSDMEILAKVQSAVLLLGCHNILQAIKPPSQAI